VSAIALGSLLDALQGVTWPARGRVRAGLPGAHRANQRGTSGEFTEYRAYRQGDDPRRLDWKLLARSDRAFVRVTDERAWVPTWLLVDASASLAFPPVAPWSGAAAPAKWAMACAVATGLAAAAHAGGDPVGLLVSTRPEPRRLPPRTRRGTVQAIAQTLAAVTPAGDAPLAPLLARLPAGARLALLTDGLGDEEALIDALARAGAGGRDVLVVQLVHPLEVAPPAGSWRVVDPERVESGRVLAPSGRATYDAQFAAWRARFARRVQATGARHASVRCDEAPARVVRRLVRFAAGGAVPGGAAPGGAAAGGGAGA
jgi:uncharacterized protein (DUF58 family)